jgi:hypothetical protein
MPLEQPEKIYRYRSFGGLTVDTLCHDQLFFANPSSFNDPMDCQPTVESDSDNTELRAILRELIQRRIESETLSSLKSAKVTLSNVEGYFQNLARETANKELANIAYNATNPEYDDHGLSQENAENWLLLCEVQRELLRQYDKGVCCFSSTVDSSLLWSHYGDQHQGLCIGYNLKRNPKPILHKVIYGNNRTLHTSLIARAILSKDLDAKQELDNSVLLRKAFPWSYEDEWRLFVSLGLKDSPLALTDVTFGLRCPSSIVHAVISALAGRDDDIKFYQMRQVRGSYKLCRKDVDVEISHYFPKIAQSGEEVFGPVD